MHKQPCYACMDRRSLSSADARKDSSLYRFQVVAVPKSLIFRFTLGYFMQAYMNAQNLDENHTHARRQLAKHVNSALLVFFIPAFD